MHLSKYYPYLYETSYEATISLSLQRHADREAVKMSRRIIYWLALFKWHLRVARSAK